MFTQSSKEPNFCKVLITNGQCFYLPTHYNIQIILDIQIWLWIYGVSSLLILNVNSWRKKPIKLFSIILFYVQLFLESMGVSVLTQPTCQIPTFYQHVHVHDCPSHSCTFCTSAISVYHYTKSEHSNGIL